MLRAVACSAEEKNWGGGVQLGPDNTNSNAGQETYNDCEE